MEPTNSSSRLRVIWQFIFFGMIGASGMIVDTAVVIVCREMGGLDVRLAAIPAFFLAVSWNYELNRRFTFREEANQSEQKRASSYTTFVLVCLLGLGVRILCMHVLIENAGMKDDAFFLVSSLRLSYIASFIGIIVASLFNFIGCKWFAFR